MKIAVEFDGTIVEDKYPGIGKEKPFASYILNALSEKGHELILYTHRTGLELEAAMNWCVEQGIFFGAVNQNHPDENVPDNNFPKIKADIYIDGRNLGGMPGWLEVFWIIHPEEAKYLKFKKHSKKIKIRKKLKNLFIAGF